MEDFPELCDTLLLLQEHKRDLRTQHIHKEQSPRTVTENNYLMASVIVSLCCQLRNIVVQASMFLSFVVVTLSPTLIPQTELIFLQAHGLVTLWGIKQYANTKSNYEKIKP